MKVRFIRDEWYPFYVRPFAGYEPYADEYEISEEDLKAYEAAVETISLIFGKLNDQHHERKASSV